MKKKILLVITALLIMMTFTSCTKANTALGFKDYIEKETDFIISEEITELFPEDVQDGGSILKNESLVKGYRAQKKEDKNKYTVITYHELKTEEEAKALYNYINGAYIQDMGVFQETEDSAITDNKSNNKNIIETDNKDIQLIIVSRVGKGIIFATADKNNKAEIQTIVKEFGF